jgi:hypothetical protein
VWSRDRSGKWGRLALAPGMPLDQTQRRPAGRGSLLQLAVLDQHRRLFG